jgi:hypothetical protein
MGTLRSLPRADVAIAVVLTVYAIGEAIAIGAPPGWFAAAPVASLALAWRRRYPAAVIALVLAVVVVPSALTT